MSDITGWAIFDLDGTLVTASPTFTGRSARPPPRWASPRCGRCASGRRCARPSSRPWGWSARADLAEAVEVFKQTHDAGVAAGCKPYAGVQALWRTLRDAGIRMAIATNKREQPARSIVAHWGFGEAAPLFACSDSAWLGGQPTKTQMVAALVTELAAPKSRVMMLGDAHEDMLAAQASEVGLPLFAAWGYGTWQGVGRQVASPEEAAQAAMKFYREAGLAAGV